jgi:hypothetical protein
MRRIVTGLFANEEGARRARDALLALGVPRDRIALHAEPAQGSPPATADAPGGEPGLPALLDTLFLPQHDLAAHHEALRRGHLVVSAEVEDATSESVIEALDDAGALDLDEHERGWREEGWRPAAAAGATTSPAAAMPGTGGMDAEAARQLGTTGSGGTIGPRDPVQAARREPPIGRARSYAIDAPLAEERDPTLTGNEGGGLP